MNLIKKRSIWNDTISSLDFESDRNRQSHSDCLESKSLMICFAGPHRLSLENRSCFKQKWIDIHLEYLGFCYLIYSWHFLPLKCTFLICLPQNCFEFVTWKMWPRNFLFCIFYCSLASSLKYRVCMLNKVASLTVNKNSVVLFETFYEELVMVKII